MEIEVIKFDNLGRGIGYFNNKIVFIPKTVPGDIVLVEKTVEKKNYIEGKLVKIIKSSKLRVKPICPYFNCCGGCDLMHINISEALDYKLRKINDILAKNNIDYEVKKIIKSSQTYNYRSRITLKVQDGIIGYYQNESHTIVEINYCYLAKEELNELLKDLPILGIKNGIITIRSNYKKEILLILESEDKLQNIEKLINKHSIVGIIQNDKRIYGEDYFIHKINDYLFKVSYDSFFQVNHYICQNLFDLIKEHTSDSINVLDLYCGVGTLSIVASKSAGYTLGVEIVANAIKDANINKTINNVNCEFLEANTSNIINKITSDYDTVILDPPRSGVKKEVLDKIIDSDIAKIIYVSCNPLTLVRDLKILEAKYSIKNITLLDMFVNTEHVECFCVLKLRK